MPDGYIAEGIPLNWLAAAAYGTKIKLVTQIPSSLESKRFDIYAKVAPSDIGRFSKLSPIERNMMLRQVLEERFHVRVHMEARLSPVYDLKIIKGGPKLVASTSQKPNVSGNPKKKLIVGRNGLKAEDVAVADLANVLWNIVGRKVIDDTGLSGLYDFTLNWAPLDAQESTTESQSENPSIFQALKDQLGLELKPSRAPIDFLVVDQLEMPSPN